ncbi:MAG: hypothetical protein DU430_09205, partial [Candidatus Tokpelaia sp.]
ASILAALGGAALAIGLALQGTLQNIAAGLMLLALRPFRINEYRHADYYSGNDIGAVWCADSLYPRRSGRRGTGYRPGAARHIAE